MLNSDFILDKYIIFQPKTSIHYPKKQTVIVLQQTSDILSDVLPESVQIVKDAGVTCARQRKWHLCGILGDLKVPVREHV